MAGEISAPAHPTFVAQTELLSELVSSGQPAQAWLVFSVPLRRPTDQSWANPPAAAARLLARTAQDI
ncbi:hypothetical protein VTH06DRAFT_5565 [Thermothelomyces fergusii]